MTRNPKPAEIGADFWFDHYLVEREDQKKELPLYLSSDVPATPSDLAPQGNLRF